jgi:hypothetical protein
VPPGTVETEWGFNETFTQRPTPQSEAAWNSLAPGKTQKKEDVHEETLIQDQSDAVLYTIQILHHSSPTLPFFTKCIVWYVTL